MFAEHQWLRRLCRAFRQSTLGTTAIEFAYLSPVFFAMIFGTFEFGWAFHCGASIRAAVTRESRNLIANSAMTADQFQTAVKKDLDGIADQNVTISFADEAVGTSTVTRVSWNYEHQVLFPLIPNVTMKFSSSMIVPHAS